MGQLHSKECTVCKKEQPIGNYYKCKNRTGKRYYKGECKDCTRQKSKRAYENNKERRLTLNAIWQANNPEKVLASKRKYYMKNYDACRQRTKDWSINNRDRHAEMRQRWYQANPEYKAHTSAKRRARELNAIPKGMRKCKIERARIRDIYKLSKLLSFITGIPHEVDHMWPIAKGGPHWSGNLQIIPRHENRSKSATLIPEIKESIQDMLDQAKETT